MRTQKQIEQCLALSKLPKTKKQIEANRKSMKIAAKVAWKLPRTQKQLEALAKGRLAATKVSASLPRTKKQLDQVRRLGKRRTVSATDIIKHHNDLCHGELRPEDVTYMTHSEHSRLHAKLQGLGGDWRKNAKSSKEDQSD